MKEAVEYTLKTPITRKLKAQGTEVREETVTDVTVRPPKGRDLRQLDRFPGKMGQSLALIGVLTGLTQDQVDDLDAEDVTGLGEIVAAFFPEPQKTGDGSTET